MRASESLLFKVNESSELGRAIRALWSGDSLSSEELKQYGTAHTPETLRLCGDWFDNLSVTKASDTFAAKYTNVLPGSNPDTELYLRLRDSSELGKSVQYLLDAEDVVREDELEEVSGYARQRWILRMVAKWFDNFILRSDKGVDGLWYYGLHYTDLAPRAAQKVVVADAESKGGEDHESNEAIKWPEAPVVPERLETFRKPPFYKKMASKVARGKPISLESPPGVGKDTAVVELAAEESKPLVVVPGDGGLRRRMLEGAQELRNGSSHFKVAEFAAAVVNGWWALITEFNAADPDVLMYVNAILAPPYMVNIHGKSYPVHPDFRLFVTYNAGLVGTKPLPQSTKSRFTPFKLGFFTEHQLGGRLEAMGMPGGDDAPLWAKYVVRFGRAMWEAYEAGHMRYQIDVRRLADAVDSILNDGDDLRSALKDAVLATIDSPHDYRSAERVLSGVMREYDHESASPINRPGGLK